MTYPSQNIQYSQIELRKPINNFKNLMPNYFNHNPVLGNNGRN